MSTTKTAAKVFASQPDDIEAGMNVRRIRKHLRLSQSDLAEALDLTFQQVQKYERGSNRISVSKLMQISRALKCSPMDILPKVNYEADDGDNGVMAKVHEIVMRNADALDILAALPKHHFDYLIKTAALVAQQSETPLAAVGIDAASVVQSHRVGGGGDHVARH